MFRQALLLLGAIVLIAAIHHRPSVCQAADELKAVPPAKAEGKQPNELDFFDIEDPSPANSGMDTMTGNEAPSKPDDKILAKPVERAARAIAAALFGLPITRPPMEVGACTITPSCAKTKPVLVKAIFPATPGQPL